MYIFAKSGYFFPIFEKGQGKPLSPPSSYAPDLTCHYSYSICFPFIKTLRRNIWKSTFKMMNILPVTFYVRVHFLKWMLKFLQTCFSSFILISWNNLRKFPFCMFSLSNWSSLFKVHLKSASKAYANNIDNSTTPYNSTCPWNILVEALWKQVNEFSYRDPIALCKYKNIF